MMAAPSPIIAVLCCASCAVLCCAVVSGRVRVLAPLHGILIYLLHPAMPCVVAGERAGQLGLPHPPQYTFRGEATGEVSLQPVNVAHRNTRPWLRARVGMGAVVCEL